MVYGTRVRAGVGLDMDVNFGSDMGMVLGSGIGMGMVSDMDLGLGMDLGIGMETGLRTWTDWNHGAGTVGRECRLPLPARETLNCKHSSPA